MSSFDFEFEDIDVGEDGQFLFQRCNATSVQNTNGVAAFTDAKVTAYMSLVHTGHRSFQQKA